MTKFLFNKATKRNKRLASSGELTPRGVANAKKQARKQFPEGKVRVLPVSGGKKQVVTSGYSDSPQGRKLKNPVAGCKVFTTK